MSKVVITFKNFIKQQNKQTMYGDKDIVKGSSIERATTTVVLE